MIKLYAFLVLVTLSGLVTHVQSAAVSAVSMTMAATDRQATKATGSAVTFAFTGATEIANTGGSVTITLPTNYFTLSSSPTATMTITGGGTPPTLSCALTAATCKIVCTTATNAVPTGATKIVFTAGQLTTGAAFAGSADGLTIVTSVDSVFAGAALSLGTVTDTALTIESIDKNQLQATTSPVTVTFTTYTSLPFASSAGKITITLPANYLSGKAAPTGVLVPVSGTATIASCAMTVATLTIICTTATADLAAGQQKITFAAGELTTGAAVVEAATGFKVATATDAVSTGIAAPALVKAVTAASITFAAGDRKAAQVTLGVTTFAFTTATTIPTGGTITLNAPANYFSAKASPAGVLGAASGTAALTGTCSLTASPFTIVCTTATADLPPGAHKITFAIGELTTGVAQAGSATGLSVKTSTDAVSLGALAPTIGTVSDVSITMATVDKNQKQATTATVTVSFYTCTTIASGGSITITTPANYFTGKDTPAGTLVPATGGTATLTSTCTLTKGTLSLICVTATANLAAGAHKITFAAGELTTGDAVAEAASGLKVTTTTDAISSGSVLPALVKAVTGVSVELSVADRVASKATSNTTTVFFTTVSTLAFASSAGKITIHLPANYLSGKATPTGVLVPAASGTATLAGCNMTVATLTIVCVTATADLAAGAHKITFAAGELITGAAASASATGLKVETATDGVSLGAAVPALDAVQAPPAAKSASSLLSAAFWSLFVAVLLNF